MGNTAPEGLIEHFPKLGEPRIDGNKKHELIDVFVLCAGAVVSGAEGWSGIEEFGRTKWLRRYVPLENWASVDDTIARIISALSVRGLPKPRVRIVDQSRSQVISSKKFLRIPCHQGPFDNARPRLRQTEACGKSCQFGIAGSWHASISSANHCQPSSAASRARGHPPCQTGRRTSHSIHSVLVMRQSST